MVMEPKHILPCLFMLSSSMMAQNLVINPSFETISSCPIGPSELDKAVPWRNPYTNVVGDTCSTSDLFNACSPLGAFGVGVPANILGNEPAHTGVGYAGIIVYEGFALFGCLNFFGSGWREYLEGTLTQPLVAGQTYCVSFHISLADNVKFASDDIGVYFSNTLVDINCTTVGSASHLPFTPQLPYNGPNITITNGWQQLSWDYVANGGEQYIIIGNFKNDANTSYECVNANALLPYAYYYIDDVSVTAGSCSQAPCDLALAMVEQNDVGCFGGADGSATVAATGGTVPFTYTWMPGGLAGAVQIGLAAGSYTVTVTDAEDCTASLVVDIGEPDPLVIATSTVPATCGQADGSATASVSGGSPGFTYSWSPAGGNSAAASGLAAGIYTVTVTDANGCIASAQVNVTQGLPTVTITGPDALCEGGSITLTANGADSYQWGHGPTGATVQVDMPGTYIVVGTNACGQGMDSVVVTLLPGPVAGIIGPDTVCTGASIVLTAAGGVSYLWSTGETTQSIIVAAGGVYTVTVTDCGTDQASHVVTEITVSAAFTADPSTGYAPLVVDFINNSTPPGGAWTWDFGDGASSTSFDPSHTYGEPGVYPVALIVSFAGCSATATGTVIVLAPLEDSDLWVPNVFSPNGDGVNDVWGPVSRGIATLEVTIYNRWGQVLRVLTDPAQVWDARTSSGERVSDGTYFYVLSATGHDGRVWELQGAFTLLR